MFLLPILAVMPLLEITIRSIPNTYSVKEKRLEEQASDIEVLLLGHSHIFYGINPTYLKQKAYNAAFNAQSFKYDLKLFKKHAESLKKLKYVILPIDYMTLYYNIEDSETKYLVKNYVLYLQLSSSLLPSDRFEIINVGFQSSVMRIYRYYIKKESSIDFTELGWIPKHGTNDLEKTGKITADRFTGYIKKGIEKHYLEENIQYINDIIQLCSKKKAKLILVKTPTHALYRKYLNPEYEKRSKRTMDEILSTNDNCYELDLETDTNYLDSDFFDGSHVNEQGAIKLSKRLNLFIEALEAKSDSTINKNSIQ